MHYAGEPSGEPIGRSARAQPNNSQTRRSAVKCLISPRKNLAARAARGPRASPDRGKGPNRSEPNLSHNPIVKWVCAAASYKSRCLPICASTGLNISRMNSSPIFVRRDALPLRFPGTPLDHGRPLPPCFSSVSQALNRAPSRLAVIWLLLAASPIGSAEGSPAQSIDRTCV